MPILISDDFYGCLQQRLGEMADQIEGEWGARKCQHETPHDMCERTCACGHVCERHVRVLDYSVCVHPGCTCHLFQERGAPQSIGQAFESSLHPGLPSIGLGHVTIDGPCRDLGCWCRLPDRRLPPDQELAVLVAVCPAAPPTRPGPWGLLIRDMLLAKTFELSDDLMKLLKMMSAPGDCECQHVIAFGCDDSFKSAARTVTSIALYSPVSALWGIPVRCHTLVAQYHGGAVGDFPCVGC